MIRSDAPRAEVPGGFLIADQLPASPPWSVPSRLSVAPGANGVPAFSLLRFQSRAGGGGMLHVSLTATPPPGGTPATLTAAYTMLRLRSPQLSGGGYDFPWVSASMGARGEAHYGLSLSAVEVGILSSLLADDGSAIEVVAILSFAAVAGAMPVTAHVDVARYSERLRASFPPGATPAADVLAEAGAQVLTADPTIATLRHAVGANVPIDTRAAQLELARRLLSQVAVPVESASPVEPPRYALSAAPGAPQSDVSLSAFRPDVLRIQTTWSVSDFLRGLSPSQRAAAFPDILNVDVLESVGVRVLATVPFDERFLARVDVGLRFHDVTNELRQPAVTLGPSQTTAEITVGHNTTRPFSVERRIAAVLRSGAWWPTILRLPYSSCSPVIEINADTLGLRFFEVSADPSLFPRTSGVRVDVEREAAPGVVVATVTLGAEAPRASVALPAWETRYLATVTALPPAGSTGSPRVLRRGPLRGRLDVSAADLLSATPVPVSLALAPGVDTQRYPYAAVTIRAPGMSDQFFLLGPQPETVQIFPADPFQPVRFAYEAEWQAKGEDGTFGPIVHGTPREAVPPTLLVDPAREGTP